MWFTFSLVTIFAWGGSNLFQKMGTNPKDKTSHWKIVIMVGTIMGIHAIGFMIYNDYSFDFFNIIKYLPVSFLYIISMVFSYVGLRYLELSILSPVSNASGAVTAILCYLILGQTITKIQFFGIFCVCAGIVLISYFQKKQEDLLRQTTNDVVEKKYQMGFAALIFPLLYCVLDGIGSFADALYLSGYMTEEDALLAYEFTFLIAAIGSFILVKFVRKQKFVFAEEKFKGLGGICETAGQFTYVFAMADNAVLAAPLIASYCVMSVILSRIILKEKLSVSQYLSILVVVIGIFILGAE